MSSGVDKKRDIKELIDNVSVPTLFAIRIQYALDIDGIRYGFPAPQYIAIRF